MRIFKSVLAAFLITLFIALLFSAYSQYSISLSTAGLVDTTSNITNQLVLDNLAYESGGNTREYVIDVDRISSLDFEQGIGGDNFEFGLTLYNNPGSENVLGPYGPSAPAGRAVCALTVPVVIYQNNRFEYAKLEVKAWRA